MLGTILFIIVIPCILFFIYRITIKYTPKLIFNEEGEISKILSKMKTLKKKYKPNTFLINKKLQTIRELI